MDFSHFLNKGNVSHHKLVLYGFCFENETYVLTKDVPDTDFYVKVGISKKAITATVYEKATDEKYVLIDVPTANGAFVSELRNSVCRLMNEVFENCFDLTDVKTKYTEFIAKEFGVASENPWNDEATVYRCANKKWFALLMEVPFAKFGYASLEKVWCVNVKADSEKIKNLIDNKTVFPAYHMNKKHWVTVLLTGVTDFEKLCSLTKRSFELVGKQLYR